MNAIQPEVLLPSLNRNCIGVGRGGYLGHHDCGAGSWSVTVWETVGFGEASVRKTVEFWIHYAHKRRFHQPILLATSMHEVEFQTTGSPLQLHPVHRHTDTQTHTPWPLYLHADKKYQAWLLPGSCILGETEAKPGLT